MATDDRVVFFAKKMGGYDLEVFPYKNITSIETGKGMGGHHVKFFASGNEVRAEVDRQEV
jgi:Bacterial PH domain